jgi:hypothetical protein
MILLIHWPLPKMKPLMISRSFQLLTRPALLTIQTWLRSTRLLKNGKGDTRWRESQNFSILWFLLARIRLNNVQSNALGPIIRLLWLKMNSAIVNHFLTLTIPTTANVDIEEVFFACNGLSSTEKTLPTFCRRTQHVTKHIPSHLSLLTLMRCTLMQPFGAPYSKAFKPMVCTTPSLCQLSLQNQSLFTFQ